MCKTLKRSKFTAGTTHSGGETPFTFSARIQTIHSSRGDSSMEGEFIPLRGSAVIWRDDDTPMWGDTIPVQG